MKIGRESRLCDVHEEVILGGVEIKIEVLIELCQRIPDGK